jgi:VWFA-related protein
MSIFEHSMYRLRTKWRSVVSQGFTKFVAPEVWPLTTDHWPLIPDVVNYKRRPEVSILSFPGKRWNWLVLALVSLALGVPAQKEQLPRYNVRVNVVSLDVEVLDRAGKPVLGLAKKDFVVREDGKAMELTNFARLQDRPVSLAIVLDTSAISLEKLNSAKQFVFQLIHLLSRDDDICLYTFDARDAHLEQDFTKDRLLLVDALENISVPAHGSGGMLAELFGGQPPTALGIDLALLNLRKTNNGKKALLIISNRFRGLGPATVDHVQDSGFTLLTLGFSNKAALLVTMGGDQISKKQLMRESGGRQFSADTTDITGVCRAIAYSLKNYYALSYLTQIGPNDEKPRHINVLIPGHDHVINARRSYIPKEKESE